eukprot:CAMPEP_0173404578 /NCGR_PEP_ID=MMETSP1356-20130122/59740_1 /TAXON_ID=77927 ORGANISM="Hemiselmis virescens, Strain PCC157" /NCGR_SAMPLE_ID=MMETSP1356 /ASSEMBLY_ACC=CAM_ASM_000847 /LENGTH=48 /DNA_ID= /DNA_START= /DNA_END= /DNA_ORIENTATION=
MAASHTWLAVLGAALVLAAAVPVPGLPDLSRMPLFNPSHSTSMNLDMG